MIPHRIVPLGLVSIVLGVVTGALAAQAPPAAPVQKASWDQTRQRALELRLKDRDTEAIAVLERFLKSSPQHVEAIYELGDAHLGASRALAIQPDSPPASRRRHLETAAAQFRRVLDANTEYRPLALMKLTMVFDPEGLDRPAELVPLARALVESDPASVVWRVKLARALKALKRDADAVKALHAGASALEGDALITLGMAIIEDVSNWPSLAPADARTLLDDAVAIADRMAAVEPGRRDLYGIKSAALLLLSTQIERDPARQRALKAASEAAFDKFHALGAADAATTPATQVPPDPMAPPAGWAEALHNGTTLTAKGQHMEAAAVYENFSRAHPTYPSAHYARIGALLRAGRAEGLPDLLTAARAVTPRTAAMRLLMGVSLWDLVNSNTSLSRADVRLLVDEANTVLDEAIALDPSLVEALVYKSLVLRQQATRVETDPARIKALTAEADRISERAKALLQKRQASAYFVLPCATWPDGNRRSSAFGNCGRTSRYISTA